MGSTDCCHTLSVVGHVNVNGKERYQSLYNLFFNSVNRGKIRDFMTLTGQNGRLIDARYTDPSFLGRDVLERQNDFLSNTSRESANLIYGQLWSNDNDSVVLENIDDGVNELFTTFLNRTNLCVALMGIIKDYIDFGFAFMYVEVEKNLPIFRVLNPLNVAWDLRDSSLYYLRYETNSNNECVPIIHILTPTLNTTIAPDGTTGSSDLLFNSFITIKPDDIDDSDGIGLRIIQTVFNNMHLAEAFRMHMRLHVNPPIVLNAHSVVDDNMLNREPGGVTKVSAASEDGSAQAPTALVIDKYSNVLLEMQNTINQNRADIQKAYRLDLLQNPDPTIRAGAFQLLRTQIYYAFIPKLISAVIPVFQRYAKKKINPQYYLRFNTIADNVSTSMQVSNMNQFLNMYGMLMKISDASQFKLHPGRLIEEMCRILNIDENVLFSDEQMAKMLSQIARVRQAQASMQGGQVNMQGMQAPGGQ